MLLCSAKTLAIRELASRAAEARRRCLLGQRHVRLRAAAGGHQPSSGIVAARADLAAAARRRASCLLTTATETCPLPSRLHV